MNAIDKEKIYDKLRSYHLSKFPDKISAEVVNLKTEFGSIEDKIIVMVLRLASGKEEFVDSAKDLGNFQNKLQTASGSVDDASRNMFVSKISKLAEIMMMAKESDLK